jgi:DNA-binding transcriptional LysR family regulator
MNFTQLQSFLALAETRSFTEAAFTLDLTQSAISHALAALEQELGVMLIERSRSKSVVALTRVGEKVLPHVRLLLAQAEAINQEARMAARGRVQGKVKLGNVPSIVAPGLLAQLLIRLRSQYPEIEVVLFEGTMREVGEWIENGTVDIGFVVMNAPEFINVRVATDELCVLVPSGHPFQDQGVVTAQDLRNEGFILERNQCSLQLMARAGLIDKGSPPQIRYRASDSATILAMVREGLGITVMPRQTISAQLDGVMILPLDPHFTLEIGLAYKSVEVLSPSMRLLVEVALAREASATSRL